LFFGAHSLFLPQRALRFTQRAQGAFESWTSFNHKNHGSDNVQALRGLASKNPASGIQKQKAVCRVNRQTAFFHLQPNNSVSSHSVSRGSVPPPNLILQTKIHLD